MRSHSQKLVQLLKDQRVVTSSDAARFLKVSWNTADNYLKELLIEGRVERLKRQGVTLWVLK